MHSTKKRSSRFKSSTCRVSDFHNKKRSAFHGFEKWASFSQSLLLLLFDDGIGILIVGLSDTLPFAIQL